MWCSWMMRRRNLVIERQDDATLVVTDGPIELYSTTRLYVMSGILMTACLMVGALIRASCVVFTPQCTEKVEGDRFYLCYESEDKDWFNETGRGFGLFICVVIFSLICTFLPNDYRMYKIQLQKEKDEDHSWIYPEAKVIIFGIQGTLFLCAAIYKVINPTQTYVCNRFVNDMNVVPFFCLEAGLWYIGMWNQHVWVNQALAELAEKERKNQMDVDKTALLA